jgi:predicted secreted protein
MKIVFDEWFGELSYAQRAAYRKHNVSPSDHDELVRQFGDDHARITRVVKDNAAAHNGMFAVWELRTW